MTFGAFGYEWSAVRAAVPADHLHMIRPASDPDLPWPGMLLGLPILGLYYWTTNQYISQRFLAAKNVDHARWGAVLAAGLKLLRSSLWSCRA
jgi:SSS family solute:Na+ symporter